ncbi:hypothetical protein Ccrd_021222 [Cynara cardunculus var. scolymus]|uniref:Leucine-rich repeat-containing protein n=1 Tax=Cynara cardunculus var. scolymus TaxID=59895 RepID=A0A103Y0Z8_CYNCS|nr:hypothetical protein Ccrd_021222 [Cynara cardunculus var. scolymus]
MKMIENHTSHGTSSSTNEKTGYDLRKNFGASPLLHRLLGSLKFLILRYCHELVSVGHFEGFPLLERLIVAGCVSLVEVCETIGNCVRLFLLDVSGCTKLKKLPRSIGKLKNLRTLLIDGCSNLGEFPVEMKDMKSLEVLTADNINMESRMSSSVIIPRSFKPFAISLPRSLVRLSLRNNNLSNESFHVDFGSLSMLVELDLSGNPIDSLPHCVRSLSRLEFLSLGGCRRLKTVLCAPSTLKRLIMSTCESLEKITFQSQMSTQPYIEYEDRTLLTEIEGTFKMQTIAEVDEEILCRLGWMNVQQHVKDQKLPMKNYISWAGFHQIPQVLPVQMLYESGIFSTFFQGSWFPDWLTYITTSSKLCFTLPSSDKKCKIRGLNLCVVTGVTSSTLRAPYPRVELRNLTKNYKWRYTPLRCVIPEPNIRSIVWLSHWVFENNEFEDGDEVVIQALVDLGSERAYKVFGLDQYYHQACGASVVYDDENKKEEDSLAYYKSWKRNIVDDETLRGGCVYFTDSLK